MTEQDRQQALDEFTAYFVKNYPGPNTIIGDPKWHAPKIFRAAEYALRSALASSPSQPGMKWIAVKDQPSPKSEPVVYCRPDMHRGRGRWHVGIAYWTVSQKWNPENESQLAPEGFTHWMPLPAAPALVEPKS